MSKPFSSLMPQTSNSAIAHSYLAAGTYLQALQAFKQIPDSDRTLDDWVNHAVCLIHLERPEAALAVCDRALILHPHHPQAWLFKGVALQRLNRYGEAYACYNQAAGGSGHHQAGTKTAWYRRLAALRGVAKHILPVN